MTRGKALRNLVPGVALVLGMVLSAAPAMAATGGPHHRPHCRTHVVKGHYVTTHGHRHYVPKHTVKTCK
jgi:hypothetical protein